MQEEAALPRYNRPGVPGLREPAHGWLNALELEFLKHLRRAGLNPQMQQVICSPALPAGRNSRLGHCKPDFMWPRKRVVLFLDGCYWHECQLHNPDAHNGRIQAKDALQDRVLADEYWLVLRYWEHDRDDFGEIAEEVREIVRARPMEYRMTYQIHAAQEATS